MTCANCQRREGAVVWVGNASAFEYARNPHIGRLWCRRCVLEAQLEHALQAAEQIPRLKRELEELSR